MPKSIILFIIMIFRMGDSFRSAAWDSQLDNMLDDLQQVVMMMVVMVMVEVVMVEMVEMVIMMVILKG